MGYAGLLIEIEFSCFICSEHVADGGSKQELVEPYFICLFLFGVMFCKTLRMQSAALIQTFMMFRV